MTYEVILGPLVVSRIDEITSYMCDVLDSPSAASAFMDSLDSLVATLETFPLSYPRPLDARLEARGYRKALVGKYVVLFRVDSSEEGAGKVYVTKVVPAFVSQIV